ncbi:MAG: molybdopterin biosynthesis protein, partial [Desulfonatronovibrionaceae bacterium]
MSEDRNIYLQVMPIEVALHRLGEELDLGSLLQIEVVPAQEAIGRVTAEPVWARLSSPTFHSAAMDGVALKAESTFRAREGSPVTLSLERDFQWVNTGGPLPPGTDAVVMIEHVQRLENGDVVLEKPAFPWQHVRRIGEDIVASELLLPRNHEVSVYDLGALLTAGIWELSVLERVNIEFIPSGDEVVDFQKKPVPGPGQVVESNSQVLAGMARDWGCNFRRRPPVPDNISELNQAVDEAIGRGAHIVVLGAGSSAGSRDFTRRVIEEKGRVLVHGIKAMPGKPTIIGCTDKTVLIGAPGYPVSSIICFERILRPVVFALQHRLVPQREVVEVFLTRRVPSRPGMEEFLRVSLGRVKDRYVATPLPRGAGSITSMTRAQGLVSVPSEAEGLEEGSLVRAELLVPGEEIERTLVVVGSHDNTLDLLANELMALDRPVRMSSTHVGSMGGLTAIKGGNAHMAGIHLFDPGSEDFNFPFLKRYLPGGQVRLFNLAVRHQGLIVPRGNPKSIKSIEDLRRNDITFINRQRGAGTRILLDYHLEKNNIAPDEVKGYENEEFTHMAVAVNVLSGIADCGLGISAAAGALGLDFVPLARERYDLLVSEDSLNDPKVRTLL